MITFDISQFVTTETQQTVIENLAKRFRLRRNELHLTQKQLAVKSGVSYASVRRFENTGEISLTSLVKLACAIDCLRDFDTLFAVEKITNLKDYNK